MTAKERPTVLVVDDTEATRNAIDQVLSINTKVIQASSTDEARGVADSSEIDIVVTDFHLGQGNPNALPFVKELAEREEHRPYIAVFSANTDPEVQKAVLLAGANEFIPAPFSVDALASLPDRVIAHEGGQANQ